MDQDKLPVWLLKTPLDTVTFSYHDGRPRQFITRASFAVVSSFIGFSIATLDEYDYPEYINDLRTPLTTLQALQVFRTIKDLRSVTLTGSHREQMKEINQIIKILTQDQGVPESQRSELEEKFFAPYDKLTIALKDRPTRRELETLLSDHSPENGERFRQEAKKAFSLLGKEDLISESELSWLHEHDFVD